MTDVARRAGVSQPTVSFVLNDRRDVAVAEETRRRVLEAAAELDFVPNRAAQSLRSNRSFTDRRRDQRDRLPAVRRSDRARHPAGRPARRLRVHGRRHDRRPGAGRRRGRESGGAGRRGDHVRVPRRPSRCTGARGSTGSGRSSSTAGRRRAAPTRSLLADEYARRSCGRGVGVRPRDIARSPSWAARGATTPARNAGAVSPTPPERPVCVRPTCVHRYGNYSDRIGLRSGDRGGDRARARPRWSAGTTGWRSERCWPCTPWGWSARATSASSASTISPMSRTRSVQG